MGLQVVRPFRHPSIPGPINGPAGGFEVVDGGIHTTTAASTNYIALKKNFDTSKHYFVLGINGSFAGRNRVAAYLQTNQIVMFIPHAGAQLFTAGISTPWRLIRVTNGRVQHGSSSINGTAAGNTSDIALDKPIKLNKAVAWLNHYSGNLDLVAGQYCTEGSVKQHATDTRKIQATLFSAIEVTYVIYWSVWSP